MWERALPVTQSEISMGEILGKMPPTQNPINGLCLPVVILFLHQDIRKIPRSTGDSSKGMILCENRRSKHGAGTIGDSISFTLAEGRRITSLPLLPLEGI